MQVTHNKSKYLILEGPRLQIILRYQTLQINLNFEIMFCHVPVVLQIQEQLFFTPQSMFRNILFF